MSGPSLLLTRPREDSLALAAELARHGVESLIEPMMTIRIDDDAKLDLSGAQAILLTSANGARALAATSPDEEARRLPVLAVGCATAHAARDAGFRAVAAADGDVDALAALAAARLRAAGFEAERAPLYDALASHALSAPARRTLEARTLAGVALFSPRTARLFAKLVHESGLDSTARTLTAFCLSQAVAEAAATLSWQRISVAAAPRQDSLVASVTGALAPGPCSDRR